MEILIYLDTHAAIWLSNGELKQFPEKALNIINQTDSLYISPLVILEMKFLNEIGRLNKLPQEIINYLHNTIGLLVHGNNLDSIILEALNMSWTRDPFDRIITAQAATTNSILITKDYNIRKNYQHALWD